MKFPLLIAFVVLLPGLSQAAEPARVAKPEIEFRVLLIIKRVSDTYSPLFLPIRAQMTDAEVAAARRCFEVETPDMVQDITLGKVRFVPTVVVSSQPLRLFNPDRRDSAEVVGQETLNEFVTLAKAGSYDSVGALFLHRDSATGYTIPRAGYGVGGFDGRHGVGLFAIHCPDAMNPRDEIYLHEWMHGLDGYYGGKRGVTLPKGALHGQGGRGYVEKPWRAGDSFRGWMEWYRDYLQGVVPEDGKMVGLGSVAWKHGPMREEQRKLSAAYRPEELKVGTYPAWVYELMKGNLQHAKLGESLLSAGLKLGDDVATDWKVKTWDANGRASVRATDQDGGTLTIHHPTGNDTAVEHEVRLEKSTNYLFSAEVRTEGVKIEQANGRFGFSLTAGSSRTTVEATGSSGGWKTVSLPLTTGTKLEPMRLGIHLGGFASLASGRVVLRKVQLRKIGYPEGALLPTKAGTGSLVP